jgi:myo-inositol-1(or 4)-monophosphatase
MDATGNPRHLAATFRGGAMADWNDLSLLRDTALEAGALILKLRAAPGGMDAWDKSPGHPVTEADMASNRLIHQRLRPARPVYGWLSEETADLSSDRVQREVFVIDPIDGTRAYMRGEPWFCICIAKLTDNRPTAAVIYAPMLDELYEAVLGGGARLNGQPIRVAETTSLEDCRMIGDGQMFDHPAWKQAWPPMRLARPKPNAMALRMALVASGRWDAAVALWRKSDWDLAAASLILQEAGGISTNHEGQGFIFNTALPVQKSVVAAGPCLHELIIQRVGHVRLPDPSHPQA